MNIREVTSTRDVRDHVIDCLRRELVGPSPGYPLVQLDGEEILRQQDPPRYRYSAGILFPAGVTFSGSLDARDEEKDIETADAVGDEGVSGEADEAGRQDEPEIESRRIEDKTPDVDVEVDPTSSFLPSTMGLSFLVDVSGGIRIDASWGTYHKEEVPGFITFRDGGPVPGLWFRTSGSASFELSRDDLAGRTGIIRPARRTISPEGRGQLEVDVVSRPREGNVRLVTVTLVNANRQKRPVNENCFFQCSLKVTPLGATEVKAYPGRPASLQDDEELSLALLYRHRPNYAV